MPTISARIDDDEFTELERVAELLDDDRSTTIRKALEEGLTELRVREAVGRYQQGDVSSNEAARIAGVSVAEWLEIARERNLTTQLSAEDLRRDAEAAQEL
jgi:predicted HTH domain antitoxin